MKTPTHAHRSPDRPRALPGARLPRAALALGAVLALLLAACGDDGSDGAPGAPGTPVTPPPTDGELSKFEDAHGVNPVITGVSGQTGPTGNFQAGDTLTVEFTLKKDDGTAWDITEMTTARIMMSGPSFNYQRVLLQQTDLASAAVHLGNGAYRYTFATPIPATYPAPYNDSGSFGPEDGELTGEALLAGTYTVGMYLRFPYTVDGESENDVGNATFDFLLGNTSTLNHHEVVTIENCNQCHSDLQAHGGQRREPKLCALCHTSGAEDRNPQTPDTSVDFRVMIHKIHNAAHLPSVNGVATNNDGSRNYAATPVPYVLAGFNTVDLSEVQFPVWPNLSFGMPRDLGYSALGGTEQGLENTILGGVTACDKCHGDPDGTGPLPAPADGELAMLQPSRAACGSCHDDVDWTKPYAANGQIMQVSDYSLACNTCHTQSGTPLSVEDAHRHPIADTDFNKGLRFVISDVSEPMIGDPVAVTFTLEDDDGTPVDPATLSTSVSSVMVGPNHNSSLLQYVNFDKAAITGAPPYTVNLPELVWLEAVGPGTAATDESFTTARGPHWHDVGSATSVRTVTGKAGGSTTLTADAPVHGNFLEVASSAGFADGEYIVIDDGDAAKEYMRIQRVDGTRLWFASLYQNNFPPSLRNAHLSGATVEEVTTSAKATPADFAVDADMATITEVGNALGTGQDILVTYTTDFLLPDRFEGAFNDSPDRDETWGDWSGKPVVPGTYRVAMWSRVNVDWVVDGDPYALPDETTAYRAVSPGEAADVLVEGATTVQSYELLSDVSNCYRCHNDIYFHGNGRRGVDTCLICHSVSGAEDHPKYRTASAPATTGVLVNFREMVHKMHTGAELSNASSYVVAGNGGSQHMYDHVEFPAWPDGTKNCTVCHGADNDAWTAVADRDHPTEQTLPAREWRSVCLTCHDDDTAAAHAETQTAAGVEACAVCHGQGAEFSVEVMHKVR